MNLDEWVISIMEQLGYLGIALLMFWTTFFLLSLLKLLCRLPVMWRQKVNCF